MAEHQTLVETYRVDYACDECKTGSMLLDASVRMNWLTKNLEDLEYTHKCSACGVTQNFKVQYPLIKYRTVRITNK